MSVPLDGGEIAALEPSVKANVLASLGVGEGVALSDIPTKGEIVNLINSAHIVSVPSSEAPGDLRWDEPWMNGFWKAVVAYSKQQTCYENIAFIIDIESAKVKYGRMLKPKYAGGTGSSLVRAAYKQEMRTIYEMSTKGVNVGDDDRKPFKIDGGFDFEAFWKVPENRNPSAKIWSDFEVQVVKFLAKKVHYDTTFVRSAAFRQWENDPADTGFNSYMNYKTKKESADPAKGLPEAHEIFDTKGIGEYHLYKQIMKKKGGSEGWRIWKLEGAHAYRIWKLGGNEAYEAWKGGGDEAFKTFFLNMDKWKKSKTKVENKLEGQGEAAYNEWLLGDEYYKAFCFDPEDYPQWKVTHIYGVKGYQVWKTAGKGEKGLAAVKVYKTAYDGCAECSAEDKEAAGKAAVAAWKAKATAHVLPQNVIIRHKKHSSPGYKPYHRHHQDIFGAYSSKPYQGFGANEQWEEGGGLSAHEPYQNIIAGDKTYSDDAYKPYHRHHEDISVDYPPIIPYKEYNRDAPLIDSDAEVMILAMVMSFIVFIIICCVCWLGSAAIGYYCMWMERNKRLHDEEKDESDETEYV